MRDRRRRAITAVGSRIRKQVRVTLLAGVVLILLLSAMGSWGTARAGPDHTCGPCGCSGCGGGCPIGTITLSWSASVVNPTNATIKLTVGGPGGANYVFYWGNTTSYAYAPEYNNNSLLSWSVFLDYLEPSTTYDFKAVASASCWNGGSTTGTWTTGSEPSEVPLTGTVWNSAGSHAGANVAVWAQCADSGIVPPWQWHKVYLTSSLGQYYIQSWLFSGSTPYYPCNGYVVEVLNWPASYPGVGTSVQWNNYWNDSITVWAPQVINFYLPRVFVGPYVPSLLMFTNSAYATLSYNETVSISTSYSAEVAGNGGSQVSTFSAQESGSNTGQPLENWEQYYTSGTVNFNGMSRQSSISNTSFYGAIQNSTTQDKASDPISPSSVSAAQCYDNGMWYNFNITPGNTRGGGVTISGSVTYTSGLNIEVDVSLELGGGVSVGVGIPIQVTFATTQSFSNAFYFSVHNTDTSQHVFRAYVQGGSNTDTGIVVHVWQLS